MIFLNHTMFSPSSAIICPPKPTCGYFVVGMIWIETLKVFEIFVHRPQQVKFAGWHQWLETSHFALSARHPESEFVGADIGGTPLFQYSTWNWNQAYGLPTWPISGSNHKNPDSMIVTFDGAISISSPTLNARLSDAVVREQQFGFGTMLACSRTVGSDMPGSKYSVSEKSLPQHHTQLRGYTKFVSFRQGLFRKAW